MCLALSSLPSVQSAYFTLSKFFTTSKTFFCIYSHSISNKISSETGPREWISAKETVFVICMLLNIGHFALYTTILVTHKLYVWCEKPHAFPQMVSEILKMSTWFGNTKRLRPQIETSFAKSLFQRCKYPEQFGNRENTEKLVWSLTWKSALFDLCEIESNRSNYLVKPLPRVETSQAPHVKI